jgi:hypothetical protein
MFKAALVRRHEEYAYAENGGLFHDPFWVTAQVKIPVLSHQGFKLVAECTEISNPDLIKDIDRIIELRMVLSLFE